MPVPSFPPNSEDLVQSVVGGTPGAIKVTNIVTLAQAACDALAAKDASTLYVVTPDPS